MSGSLRQIYARLFLYSRRIRAFAVSEAGVHPPLSRMLLPTSSQHRPAGPQDAIPTAPPLQAAPAVSPASESIVPSASPHQDKGAVTASTEITIAETLTRSSIALQSSAQPPPTSSPSDPISSSPSASFSPSTLAPTISSSAASSPTSFASSLSASSTSAVHAASSVSSTHSATFYVGIVFGVIIALGFIAAVLTWWIRVRSRRKRRALERMTTWPWDQDVLGAGHGTHHGLEDGMAGPAMHHPVDLWDPGEPKDTEHDPMYDPPIRGFPADGALADSLAFPLPPVHIRAHAQLASSYPTIPLHSAHQSVPDLAPDMGTLKVANLMPGDISMSGDESSRASTALGMAHTLSADCGTPYEPMVGDRPRFLGLDEGGLAVPWAPLHPRRPTVDARHSNVAYSEKDWEPLPYPGDVQSTTVIEPESWTTSLRSNLVNALNAVIGGSNSTRTADGDNLTRVPRRSTRGHRITHTGVDGTVALMRTNTLQSTASSTGWMLEESHIGAGVVCTRNSSQTEEDDFSTSLSRLLGSIQKPPTAVVRSHDRNTLLSADPPGCITRASSVYSSTSETSDDVREYYIGALPPRLPSIPSLSRSSTESSQIAIRNYKKKSVHIHPRKKTKRLRRPTILTRVSSSQCSVGSEMSRTSSARSEQLTDQEAFAKRALRERRRRVMEMSIHGKGAGGNAERK
ncbi:hypothetical protein A0H81_05630 [Grifola frondosa]|uniref:Uncharacterized protein n=1 Tax=Grifola frondosa TaxID=5627 RepID=A0A1C7MCN5_GRIFR|nr:hypothetical protein A0H81_05630 [Grifola frondosa]